MALVTRSITPKIQHPGIEGEILRPKVFLILRGRADYNGACKSDLCKQQALPFLERHHFIVINSTVFSIDCIKKQIQLASKIGEIAGLMIQAHGERAHIFLCAQSLISKHTFDESTFEGLDEHCKIFLHSCNTGVPDEQSGECIASIIAKISNKPVFAPSGVTVDTNFTLLLDKHNELACVFEEPTIQNTSAKPQQVATRRFYPDGAVELVR